MNSFWTLLGVGAAASFVFMNLGFALGITLRDNSIVDVLWGLSFVVVAVAVLLAGHTGDHRAQLLCAMYAIWGVRLAAYIGWRKRGQGEDPRYAAWRTQWGERWKLRSWLQVFMFQWLLVNAIGVAMALAAAGGSSKFSWLDVAGVLIWALGTSIEAVADAQVQRFRTTRVSRDEFVRSGLWRYSRHPNYFGEALLWWGVAIVSVGSQYGWAAFGGAAVVTVLVRFVSGVPHLERRWTGNQAFAEYARRTNAFIPWLPRKA